MTTFVSPQSSMPFDASVGKSGPGFNVFLSVSMVHVCEDFILH